MGLVHDERATIALLQRGVSVQRGAVAVHAKQRLGDYEALTGAGLLLDQALQGFGVAVREHDSLGLR